jgi:uncharacterized protein (TIGR01777 family)
MRIAVTGASGLIGGALVPHLRAQGHEVDRLVRRPATARDEITWDPVGGTVDLSRLEGVDAVVHLAGEAVGDHRWDAEYKALILNSRVQGTRTIATAMASLERRPSVLVSASAHGYYGDTGDRAVDESDPAGPGYFAEVCVQWEAAADPARAAGIRVVHSRSGLVVSGRGGAWGKLWPVVRMGVGGKLGTGRQWWSFISLRDEVAALTFLLQNLEGGVNLTAPNPVTNAEMTKAMGQLLRRPTVFPVPGKALQLVLGEFSSEITGSLRVLPTRLLEAGFEFQDPTIDRALAWAWATR